ncbi:MAG: hypothetical protein JKY65_17810, partial [Planctomycetes bacterium]|nr:hypothetical protein [Planctomycetota bacterium]
MNPRLHNRRPQALAILACLLAPSLASAKSPVGTYELAGRRDDAKRFDVRLRVFKRPNGKLAVERHHMISGAPAGRARWVKWRSFQVSQQGERLQVVYTLPALGRLSGAANRVEGRSVFLARQQNSILAGYRIRPGGGIREVLHNRTRLAPETSWRTALAEGGVPTRLRLGQETALPVGGQLALVLPCSGTLHLSGGAKLRGQGGGALRALRRSPGQAPSELRYSVSPGRYEVRGTPGTKVRAILVQEAQLAGSSKPWTGPTYYPVHEFEESGRRNHQTLYRPGGPLERFDRAFKLRGDRSAVAWERGDSNRTEFSFDSGHYLRRGVIRERKAEVDFHADLDGDGRIGASAARVIARLDHDRDGRVTSAELKRAATFRLRRALFRLYDYNRNGRIEVGLDVDAKDAAPYDLDRDGLISRIELLRLIEGKGPLARQVHMLRSRFRDVLMARVRRERDLTAAELKAGAYDFVDDKDVDRDGRTAWDRNSVVALKNGRVRVASRIRSRGRDFLLDPGTERERAVPRSEVLSIRRGGDGDFADEYTAEWWGHCNGVALAGILFEEPRQAIRFEGQTFRPADLKGLLSEYALGEANLKGFRWRHPGGAPRSLPSYTSQFHRILRTLKPGRLSLMADVELKPREGGGEVWNYALTGYRLVLLEAPGDDPHVLSVQGEVRHTGGGAVALDYQLHFGAGERVRSDAASKTTWRTRGPDDGRSQGLRFLRYLFAPKPIEGHDRSSNPFVNKERLSRLFGGQLPYRSAPSPLA